MRTPISLGFLTPEPGRVFGGPWLVISGDAATVADPESVPDWDYFTPLRVQRTVSVQLDQLRQDCGLSEDSTIAGVLTWHSSWTNLRGTSESFPLRHGENLFSLELPGEMLGGRLNLETRIVLGPVFSVTTEIAPHRPGSTLWVERTSIELEGSGTRFPLMPVPFEQAGIAGGRTGAWALQIDSDDLAASGTGVLRLCLNSSHPRVRSLLENPEAESSGLLRELIHYDVARQLFLFALVQEGLDDADVYEDGTLGAVLQTLAHRSFPDMAFESLRGYHRTAPGEFEAELQGRLRLLAD